VTGVRTAIVTGGTGALGRAVVAALLEAGDRVAVPWIVAEERDALASSHPEACSQGALLLLEADVAEAEGAASLAAAAPDASLLVNGVGGFDGGAPVHETGLEVWDRLYRMNVRTAVATTRAVVPGMIAGSGGVIVNVASQAAPARPAGLAAYSASKDAVIVLTETLQKELGDHHIRVNAVAPGTIDTPANRQAMPDADSSAWTPPERIAQVIRWLASDAASSVRGAVIPV
jgi:NAD(P)-dependent dehydrogenase (short-subunit alcohol dehydrogenase family)